MNRAPVFFYHAGRGRVLFWLATGEDGSVTRLDASGSVAPIGEHDLVEAAARLAGSAGIADQDFITEGDAYYIGDRSSARLPVYRVIANDAESTCYYLDPNSGALVQRADLTAAGTAGSSARSTAWTSRPGSGRAQPGTSSSLL